MPVSTQPIQLPEPQAIVHVSVHPSVAPTQLLQPSAPEMLPYVVPPASAPDEPLRGAGTIGVVSPTTIKGLAQAKTCWHMLRWHVLKSLVASLALFGHL